MTNDDDWTAREWIERGVFLFLVIGAIWAATELAKALQPPPAPTVEAVMEGTVFEAGTTVGGLHFFVLGDRVDGGVAFVGGVWVRHGTPEDLTLSAALQTGEQLSLTIRRLGFVAQPGPIVR